MRRRFYPHRQAYAPVLWPMYLVAVVVTAAIVVLLSPPWWVDLLIANMLAFVATEGRWAIWRRQHPPLELQEYAKLLREAAPWN